MPRGFQVRALGEIAIRCADLKAMMAFYGDVLGLELLSGGHRGGIVFYQLGESHGGHMAVLALFQHDAPQRAVQPTSAGRPVTGAAGSLHHLALTVAAQEQDAVIAWYETQGLSYRVEEFPWIGWRGIFTEDPEGNTVELVAKIADPHP
ncbi:MAG: VOC family protein [Paracoccaceae bacterium]